jgi:hypothetical protein
MQEDITNKQKEHLVIIIDDFGKVTPKKYSCPFESKTKEHAIKAAKAQYELNNMNIYYKSYYFEH